MNARRKGRGPTVRPTARLSARPTARLSAGQALVEFALVVPVFAVLLFGMIDVGRLVYIGNALSEGAREGARWGSVQGRSNTAAGRASIATHTSASMAGVADATIGVTCELVDGTPETSCATNDVLVVTVSSQVSLFTPVISGIVGTRTLSAESKVVVNQ